MQTTKFTDGTTISFETHGAQERDTQRAAPACDRGPEPLILVHGSTGSRESWLPHLREAGPLVAMDRRGRGESGDAPDSYALEREVGDVEAVLETTGAMRLFGHSFGGLCALNVATRDAVDLEKIVLFEPAILVGEHRAYDAADRMADLLDDGDREGAMRLAFREMTGIEDVEALPHWPEVIELAEVTQREFEAVEFYELPGPLDVDPVVLLLTGEHSPDFLTDAVREVHDRLPESRLVEVEGVGHTGLEDPARTMSPVVDFLTN
ncbi:hydrolase or acyltransferase of alpha/beta superfamily protein [Salinarchaeum sp. Harcht-Bsk1]|uniref:alpha/beta fold hydrolase n=1 Tax=Salinarchaeum sp. Harcht-Bsk1 TaxID=1333523 RepID=UPI000342370C|nr:alpha/beta hydrolase [Salinarchaeum sp. Harcht-Bsk1]AGN01370.1 hydrolase or acyltransferase of alpha/beta superfamily protein [Salinarchaeum sp. Harcht-Bsk1]